ncbi:MAG: hypothetical protein JXB32_23655 [Deltaproteobacteria bacterium]|nr:hypothetical protein [Deltaproteobacteria bacterium]
MAQVGSPTWNTSSAGRRRVVWGVVAAALALSVVGFFVWHPWSGSGAAADGPVAPASSTVGPRAALDPSALPGAPPVPSAGPPLPPVAAVAPAPVQPVVPATQPVPDAGPGDAALESRPAEPDGSPAVAPPAPIDTPADTVTIRIEGLPRGARVVYGAERIEEVPFQVPKSSLGTLLVVTAPGYEPYRESVVADRDVSLSPRFRRAPAGTSPRPPPTAAGTTAASTTPPTPAPDSVVQGARGTEIVTTFQ